MIKIGKGIFSLILTLTLTLSLYGGVFAEPYVPGYSKHLSEDYIDVPFSIQHLYPRPISDFRLELKNENSKNVAIMSITTEEEVDLLVRYNLTTKKEVKGNIYTIKKDSNTVFKNIVIPLNSNFTSIDLLLSNDFIDFQTTIQIQDGKIINPLSINSVYYFKDNREFGMLASVTESEPNNSSSAADTAYNGYDHRGSLPSVDNEDWWTFTLNYRSYVNVFLGNIPTNSDWDIYLYTSNNTTNEIWKGTNSGNQNELVLDKDLQPGKYYIKVKKFSGDSTSQYNMRWKINKHWPVLWSLEINNKHTWSSSNLSGHKGIDVDWTVDLVEKTQSGCNKSTDQKTPCYSANDIVAVWDGKVAAINNSGPENLNSYGRYVYIDSLVNGQTIRIIYAHLYDVNVTAGQSITAGQKIGTMGNTGNVYGGTGVHLHFETRVDGTTDSNLTDPQQYFPDYSYIYQ